jgi:hypothetical protein
MPSLPDRPVVLKRGLNEAAGFSPVTVPRDNVAASRARVSLTRNITNIYRDAPEATKVAGRQWYPKAHEEAASLGRNLGSDTRTGAGIIAAVSPSMSWENNIPAAHQIAGLSDRHIASMAMANEHQKAAASLIKEHEKVGGKGSAPAHLYALHDEAHAVHMATRSPLSGTPLNSQSTDNIVKAARIRSGESPESVLPQRLKTGNFYRNVNDPSDAHAVTVDTHAHDAARMSKLPFKTDRGLSAVGRYDHFAGAYRNAAARVGEDQAHVVQATVWQHWKDNYGNDTSAGGAKPGVHEEPTGAARDRAEAGILARHDVTIKKYGRPPVDPQARAAGW